MYKILFYSKFSATHLLCADDIGVLTVMQHACMTMDTILAQKSQKGLLGPVRKFSYEKISS